MERAVGCSLAGPDWGCADNESTMLRRCIRCQAEYQPPARYCARCGLPLPGSFDATVEAGRVNHPQPLQPPTGFRPCGGAVDLFYQWEAASGGSVLLGTETLAVILFNVGYPLAEATFQISGHASAGRPLFSVEQRIDELPRGEEVRLEVPSYELPETPADVEVRLISAEFQTGG